MSMSTLGAQLAALNNSAGGAGAGSSLPASKRHEDAIGRGLNHSVQIGHSKFTGPSSRPSIIYQNSKQAADVPIATIKENCVSSLRQLQSIDDKFGTYVGPLCKNPSSSNERGLLSAAENDKVDTLIQDLLYRLSLQMGTTTTATSDNPNFSKQTTFASCLHVIEYLLRRFDMHIRPKTASTALLVMLPHHEQPFFLRLLQLIDLANIPTWSFLRPYAVPNARVSRQVISKQVSKDTALLREICKLAQQNAKLGRDSSSRNSNTNDGVEASLSFVAAVAVEALTLQLQTMGSIDERTCQAILPYCVAACKSEVSSNYMQWGHVVASTIVECCILAPEPRKVLVTSVLQGLALIKDDSIINNGLLVALTILVHPVDNEEPHQLVLVGGSSVYGCALDKHIFHTLSKVNNKIAERLGRLQEEYLEIRHLIASALVFGWSWLQQQTQHKKDKTKEKFQQFMSNLITDPRLQSGLWKPNNGEWIQSYCSHIVTHTSFKTEKAKRANEFAMSLLEQFRQIDAAAYEKGIVHALVRSNKEDRIEIANWLGLKKDSPIGEVGEKAHAEDGSLILPPRIALEHADASVRLDAIPRVLEEATNEMDVDGKVVVDDSLQGALLRRFVGDDDAKVASAAAEAFLELLEKKQIELGFQEDALGALHRWAEDPNVDKDSRSGLLQNALRICTCMAQSARHESDGPHMVRLIEGIASYLNDASSDVKQEAAKAVVLSLKTTVSRNKGYEKHANLLLASDEKLMAGFQRKWSSSDTQAERMVRRRFMPILLTAITEGQKPKKREGSTEKQAGLAVEYCSWAIASFSHDMTATEKEYLSQCLLVVSKNVAVHAEKIPIWFQSLADVDEMIFVEVLAKFFKGVCDGVKTKNGDPVPGVAVLLEAALSSTSNAVISNLLQVVSLYVENGEAESLQHGFIQTLALIAHSDAGVRRKATDIICEIGDATSKRKGSEWATLNQVSQYVRNNKSSATLGGQQFLPNLFVEIMQSSNKVDEPFLCCILSLCVFAATACTPTTVSSLPKSVENSWLGIAHAKGGHNAALTIMKAIKLAGEATCPITLRWKYAGKPIIKTLMGMNFSENVPDSLFALIDEVTGMLKGVKVTDSTAQKDTVIITSGPTSRGGRSRSYSFGKSDSYHFLKPYPKDMQDSILHILSGINENELTRQVGKSLFFSTFCSKSWGEQVFTGLPRSFILDVSSSVLVATAESGISGGEDAFFSLPLQSVELAGLLKHHLGGPSFFVSYLSDYISNNAARLSNDSSGNCIYPPLFQHLEKLSYATVDHDDSNEFARQALTEALLQLVQNLPANVRLSSFAKPQNLNDWVTLLVDLVSGENSNIRTLETIRSRRSNLQLLASLCTRFPAVIVDKLIPAMSAIVSSTKSEKEAKLSSESLSIIVPVYFQHSKSTDMSPAHMISSFLFAASCVDDYQTRSLLYRAFSDALGQCPDPLLGPFVSASLASEANLESQTAIENAPLSQLARKILTNTPIEKKIDSLWTMVNYSREILLNMDGIEEPSFNNDILLTAFLVKVAKDGPSKDGSVDSKMVRITNEDRTVLQLCTSMMNAVQFIVSSQSFRKFVRKVDGDGATPVLRLWQDLLLLQNSYNSVSGRSSLNGAESFQETIGVAINESLSSIHNSLPAHIFLAFATNLIKEGDNEEVRARALQLVAEGASTLEPSDREASLYRDMIPFLATIIGGEDDDSSGFLVRQSSFVTSESIVRLLCIPASGSTDVKKRMEQFKTLFQKSSDVVEHLHISLDPPKCDFGSVSTASKQLFCSAALCLATTVRICGPRCLALLPKPMKAFGSFLSVANLTCMSSESSMNEKEEASLIQISILRSLCSIIETLPQFLTPHLGGLFGKTGFPCRALWKSDNDQSLNVREEAMKLESILTSNVSPRLLIPAASTALVKLDDDDEVLSVLSILTKSVQNSREAELAGLANSLVKAATFGFEHDGITSLEHPRIVASTQLLTSLILKLSEVQLRSLYAKLREWRGEIDKSDLRVLATRRVAFWSLSAGLAQKLKSIYLPCLASVFSDAVDELEVAAAALCKRGSAKKSDGKKKQRLDEPAVEGYRHESLLSLQALLLCLERSLKSDAHGGGAWVRDADSQRFNSLLDALSKLFHCQIPSDMSSSLNYQSVVQGEDLESGSVVDCLVALATAGGDEQLWKPLNHAVLQACSNTSMVEVRKAGITCLYSLIKAVGEEYMVLIPECLPVLSELLEDSDEDIAGLAQDCITQSEELLGESLEDNL